MSSSETTSKVGIGRLLGCDEMTDATGDGQRESPAGGLILYDAPGRYPSGQRGQPVKLLRKLRWFESNPAHSARRFGGRSSFFARCGLLGAKSRRYLGDAGTPVDESQICGVGSCARGRCRPRARGVLQLGHPVRQQQRRPHLLQGAGRLEALRREGPSSTRTGISREDQRTQILDTSWRTAFDASPQPSLQHLANAGADVPDRLRDRRDALGRRTPTRCRTRRCATCSSRSTRCTTPSSSRCSRTTNVDQGDGFHGIRLRARVKSEPELRGLRRGPRVHVRAGHARRPESHEVVLPHRGVFVEVLREAHGPHRRSRRLLDRERELTWTTRP